MTKVMFSHPIDGKIGLDPCLFSGFRVNSKDEFIQVMKSKYYSKERGYKGTFFSTKDRNIKLLFAGNEYQHGEGGKWKIIDTRTLTVDNFLEGEWFSIKNTDHWFGLLPDAEEIDAKIAFLDKLVKQNGGLEIRL